MLDELLKIPIVDKQHAHIQTKLLTPLTITPKTLKLRTQLNPITSSTKNTPHKEIKDYCLAPETTILVLIVDPYKYSTLLFETQLHGVIHPASENNMEILDDEIVITEKFPPKMNSVRIIMMFKPPKKRRELMMIMPPLKQLKK